MKARQLIRRLKAAGVEIIESRGKGGHVVARYGDRQTTIPIHGSRDIGPISSVICASSSVST